MWQFVWSFSWTLAKRAGRELGKIMDTERPIEDEAPVRTVRTRDVSRKSMDIN